MRFKSWWSLWLVSSLFFLSLTLVGAHSYFSSQTKINSNVLSFGTLVMKLNGDHDSLTAVWSQSNLAPGDSVSGSFNVSNAGSLNAKALGLKFSNSGFNPANNPSLPSRLRITNLSYNGTQLMNTIETALTNNQPQATISGITVTANSAKGLVDLDANGNKHLSLAELDNQELIIKSNSGLNGLTASSQAGVDISLYFVPGSDDNIYQGDEVVTNITGTLYQVAP